MSIYAIGDLHFNQSGNKTMDIFGEHWRNHVNRIQQNWRALITPDDTVLLPGDISWAMDIQGARADMEILESLPGRKILLTGNHDYWWDSVSKVRKNFPALTFIQNDSVIAEDIWICGARGWLCPHDPKFTQDDLKVYNRELVRLSLSLEHAMRQGARRILLMFHFPPTNAQRAPSGFLEILKKYPVTQVVYGHLHGQAFFQTGITGEADGVTYHLVSADYLEFKPKRIIG